jgi:hypothetical protein
MNNNKNILNSLPTKNYTIFIIVILILIVTFVIVIINNHLNHKESKQKFIKNVFFVEMDNHKKDPFDASRIPSKDKGKGLVLVNKICIRGTKKGNYIPNDFLYIKMPYLLMFWFNINSEKINEFKQKDVSLCPLLYFTQQGYNEVSGPSLIEIYPSIQYYIPNSSIEILVGDIDENSQLTQKSQSTENTNLQDVPAQHVSPERLYNIPIDTWNCISTVVNSNHLNLYLNGKLMKVIEYQSSGRNNFDNFNMYIGPFPGEIAYLQVNNDSKYFNSKSIYNEYLFYKEKIDKYLEAQYHNDYKVSTLKDHSNYNFSRYHRRPKEDRTNKCN